MNRHRSFQLAITGIAALGLTPALADNGDEQTLSERRDQLLEMADQTVENLREMGDDTLSALWDEAYGYAVFDATKGGLIVTGTGGTGVARPMEGDERVFMHMGGGGFGLGAGLENYKLVLLLQDQETFSQFVDGQWSGNLSVHATAGEEGVGEGARFINGVTAYSLSEAGLIAQVDLTGVRFWASNELNPLP